MHPAKAQLREATSNLQQAGTAISFRTNTKKSKRKQNAIPVRGMLGGHLSSIGGGDSGADGGPPHSSPNQIGPKVEVVDGEGCLGAPSQVAKGHGGSLPVMRVHDVRPASHAR